MKAISPATAGTIVVALVNEYTMTRDLAAYWDARAQQMPGNPEIEKFRKLSHQTLDSRMAAIKEVAEELAPWIATYDECKAIFQPEAPRPPTQEATP